MSELVEYLRSALTGTGKDVATYEWMSDEETAAIEQTDDSRFTVRPWLEQQDDIDPSVPARFGERSLVMRGLLVAGTDPETGEPALVPSDELRFLADTRRLGVAYILARAIERGRRSARTNILQEQIGSYEEDIDDEGIHLFSACTYRATVSRLAEWALPNADRGGVQMRTRISTDRWQRWIINELGVDVRAVELDLFFPGTDGEVAPQTWLLAQGLETAILAEREGESLQITSMTRTRLEELLAERIAASLGVQV